MQKGGVKCLFTDEKPELKLLPYLISDETYGSACSKYDQKVLQCRDAIHHGMNLYLA